MFNCLALFVLFFSSFIISNPYEGSLIRTSESPRTSIKGIDAIYVINLDIRPELWHRVEPELYFHGVDFTRFSAVWGVNLPFDTLSNCLTKHLGPGALGCMLSHLSIYQEALRRDLEVIWVMEDDVEICRDPSCLSQLLQELNKIDANWDILYTDLDYISETGELWRSLGFPTDKKVPFPLYPLSYYTFRANVSKNIQFLRSRYGTCSMIISKRGMKKLLDHFSTNDDILWPFDIELHYTPNLRQYGLRDPVAKNGHFHFNYSDAGFQTFKNYIYEIDDEHFHYVQEHQKIFGEIMHTFKYAY